MQVIKRNGKLVKFSCNKIVDAIEKSMAETVDGIDYGLSLEIAMRIERIVAHNDSPSTVEDIQDMVEKALMDSHRKEVAKKYILYREYRNQIRQVNTKYKLLDDDFISQYKHRPSPMQPLGEFVYYRTYSRWLPEEKRREYWWETVRRAIEFNCSLDKNISADEAKELYDNMFNLKQFLSGRTMWVGMTDVSREYGMSNFNCAFTVIDDFVKFREMFYLLMVGTGVGFRVLKSDVAKLPKIKTKFNIVHDTYNPVSKMRREDNSSITFMKTVAEIVVGDSKEGWSQAIDLFLKILYERDYKNVDTIVMNYNNVRPKGEKLKRFGGTASGHESLKNMFDKIATLLNKVGKESGTEYSKLRPIHCLDIANIIGENVVVGGVRRTAEVGLIGADDKECIEAKAGLYFQDELGNWVENKTISHRKMSNNSIFYFEKPTREQLHWQIKQMRYSGEPAFVNVESARKRRPDFEGVNPCVEVLLRDRGLCNLTTINMMGFVKDGTLDIDGLMNAQRLSARAGIRMTCLELELDKWNNTQAEDRLIGCSLTGYQDAMNAVGYDLDKQKSLLHMLHETANLEGRNYAKELGIPEPKLVCTVKPEGTQSQVAGVSSGLHYSHSPYFVRRVRINANDPLVRVCEELGYPVHAENGQDWDTCTTKVVEFPVQAPEGKTKYDVSAIEQLEIYKMFQEHYTDHNTSITVHVRNHEWEEVEQWMWNNWDSVVAVSFLALDESFYPLLPYEAITQEEYDKRVAEMKPFVPSLINKYEKEEQDLDAGSSECTGGICPIR